MRVLLFLCMALSLTACSKPISSASKHGQNQSGTDATAAIAQSIRVTLTQPKRQTLQETAELTGTLEAIQSPEIAAEIPGVIAEVLVEAGQTVSKGTLLATIDETPEKIAVAAAVAEVQRLDALLQHQSLTVARLKTLVAKKAESQNLLDEANTQYKALLAQKMGAQAGVDDAQFKWSKTRIIAPIDGVIQKRSISVGDFVNMGSPLFDMVQISPLRAHLLAPEHFRSDLFVGQPIVLSSLLSPGQTLQAQLTTLLPTIEPRARTQGIWVDFVNEPHWEPGASVRGLFVRQEKREALTLPEICVIERPEGAVVYRLKGDQQTVDAVPVNTGLRTGGWVEILSGIQDGEQVVQDGAGFLDQDMAINIKGSL